MKIPPELTRSLRDTWLTGRDPAPVITAGRLARVRRMLPGFAALVAGLLAWSYAASGDQLTGVVGLIVGAMCTAPAAIAVRHSLLAWRWAWLAAFAIGQMDLRTDPNETFVWHPVQLLVLLFVLFVVAVRQRPTVVLWVAGFTLILVWRFIDEPDQVSTSALFALPLVVGGLLRSRFVAQRRLAAEEERGAVLTERARIARELHDVVAHHMSMVAVRAETAPYRLGEVAAPARQEFAEISAASREALAEMRRLLGVLRDGESAAPVSPQPGLADVEELIATTRQAGGDVSVEWHGQLDDLPSAVDVSAYRIVQEALSNAVRHAPGAPVTVAVRRTGDEVMVSVTNGPPTGPRRDSAGAGHGLRGIRERVGMLGGELTVGATADGGFAVRARLPLRDPGGEAPRDPSPGAETTDDGSTTRTEPTAAGDTTEGTA